MTEGKLKVVFVYHIDLISPDGQYIVFERVEKFDTTSNPWIINRDGSFVTTLIAKGTGDVALNL